MKEKRERLRKEKENEENHSRYVVEVTRIRGELEKNFLQQKKQNQVDLMQFNQKMATKKQIQKENEKRDQYFEQRENLRFQEEIRKDTEYVPHN
jgi:hypothetical protein